MTKPPAFQMYASDFFMDTNDWSVEEVGVYVRLLMTAWVNGSIPDDPKRLARISGCGSKKFGVIWKKLRSKWTKTGESFLVNLRMEEVRENQRKYSESRKKAADKRWHKDDAYAYANAMRTECSSSSTSYNSTINTLKEQPSAELLKKKIWEMEKVLYERFPEIRSFIGTALKSPSINLNALYFTLKEYEKRCLTIKKPWAYCMDVLSKQNQNYNAQEAEERHKETKQMFKDFNVEDIAQ